MFTLRTHILDIKARKSFQVIVPIDQSNPESTKLCSILLVDKGSLRVADISVNHNGMISIEDSLAKVKWPLTMFPESHGMENLPRSLIEAAGLAT